MYPIKIKEKYDQNNLSNLWHRFSVPYLWTYISGDFRENVWSHPWVDITPETNNQDVYSILDAEVFKTWEDGAYWKYIFLEHKNVPNPDDLTKTTTLYSCYQHLSDIKVNIWDKIKEGHVIWKTWNTWNSFGEHLHFQIDKIEAPFHAYWPFTWAEAKAAGQSFSWWVNIWLWIEKARMYTVNPLVYLDKLDEYREKSNTTPSKVEEVKKEEKVEVKLNEIKVEPTPIIKEEKIVLETPILSNEKEDIISVPKVEKIKTEPTPIVKEEKIEMLKNDDNIIVSNPTLDFLLDDKKKTLKI